MHWIMSGNNGDTARQWLPQARPTVIPHGHVGDDLLKRRLLARVPLVLLVASIAELVAQILDLAARCCQLVPTGSSSLKSFASAIVAVWEVGSSVSGTGDGGW